MNVFSTELGIRLSFVKTSEFRGEFEHPKPPPHPHPPSVRHWLTAQMNFCPVLYIFLSDAVNVEYSRPKTIKIELMRFSEN